MNPYFQSVNIFNTLFRWRKHLIVVGLLAIVASAIFSSPAFIKPRYKSFAILYPTNLIAYSEESPTEQMVQLLKSTDIRDQVIATFNLYQHYQIDTVNNPIHYTLICRQYDENVSINKTEYESVEIVVYDTDPQMASSIADSLVYFMNIKARNLQRDKSFEVLRINEKRLALKKAEMDSLEREIQNYRDKYKLLDYKTQAKEYARAYAKALQSGSQRAIAETRQMLETLGERGGEFNALNEHLWRIRGTYNDIKIDYDNSIRDVTKELTYDNVVTHPVPADKKSYPIRWLIVVVSLGVTLLLSFLIIMIVEHRKKA